VKAADGKSPRDLAEGNADIGRRLAVKVH
jgi:hypothetical protein